LVFWKIYTMMHGQKNIKITLIVTAVNTSNITH